MIGWASYPYAGQVVLVTGAGTGIGAAIATAFLEQGAKVALTGRTETHLEDVAKVYPQSSLVIPADLTEPGAADRVVSRVLAHFGRLDAVIAAAGTSEPSSMDTFADDAWDRMRAINLDAMISTARATIPALKASRGTFTAISSIAGLRGDWGMFAYNATKAAVNVLVQSLALDLGADGVRVNAIAPAFTMSRLTQERLDDVVFQDRLLDRVALGRIAQPADIARVALFLASPDAGYITGAIIPVDGGTTASSGTPRPL